MSSTSTEKNCHQEIPTCLIQLCLEKYNLFLAHKYHIRLDQSTAWRMSDESYAFRFLICIQKAGFKGLKTSH